MEIDSEDAALYEVQWIPPGFAWVVPLKDIKAQILAVRAGFISRSEVVSQGGYDSEAIDREIAADNKRADSLGLRYESDARQADALSASSGQTPETAREGESEEDEEESRGRQSR